MSSIDSPIIDYYLSNCNLNILAKIGLKNHFLMVSYCIADGQEWKKISEPNEQTKSQRNLNDFA
jgi:hypothetical protein